MTVVVWLYRQWRRFADRLERERCCCDSLFWQCPVHGPALHERSGRVWP